VNGVLEHFSKNAQFASGAISRRSEQDGAGNGAAALQKAGSVAAALAARPPAAEDREAVRLEAEALVRAARRDEQERDAALREAAGEEGDPDDQGRQPGGADPAAAEASGAPRNGDHGPIERYDDVEPEEVVALLGSMDSADLLALRDHERSAAARPRILAAIDGVLARREAAQRG
jgi:hypothetical protein